MIRTILFDLDGTLLDARWIHFDAFNEALGMYGHLSATEHLKHYDGLSTRAKLKKMVEFGKLPSTHFNDELEDIYKDKQRITHEMFEEIEPHEHLIKMCSDLKGIGFQLGVCTNSIRETVDIALDRMGIAEYMDVVLSNEDVTKSKPDPEMYIKAMYMLKTKPQDTLIFEDSKVGLDSAYASGAHVCKVNDPSQMDSKFVQEAITNTYKVYL